MKITTSTKPADVKREWYIVDATDVVLGRLSTEVAMRLRGKHKPEYTPHVDTGDNIIIINAEKVRLTGNKANPKDGLRHWWHTGFAGGIKSITAGKELEGRFPERVIERAIKRMMPKGTLGRDMFRKVHIYAGSEHPHAAQKPKTLDLAKITAKKNAK